MPTGNGPRPTLLPKWCLGMSGRTLVVPEQERVGMRLKAQVIVQAPLLPLFKSDTDLGKQLRDEKYSRGVW